MIDRISAPLALLSPEARARARAARRLAEQGPIFENLLETAEAIAARNPLGLIDLVKAILRPLQSEHIIEVALNRRREAPPAIEQSEFFMPNQVWRLAKLLGLPSRDAGDVVPPGDFLVHLGKDLVLPTPWVDERFDKALSEIGTAKIPVLPQGHLKSVVAKGPWKSDPNHKTTIWLPCGIVFVESGNHSISAGILAGEGTIVPKEVYDLGRALDRVKCDGRRYYRIEDGVTISEVTDLRRAAVFEIGRLMRNTGVSAFGGVTDPQKWSAWMKVRTGPRDVLERIHDAD